MMEQDYKEGFSLALCEVVTAAPSQSGEMLGSIQAE